ncbi:type II toxin-antitoxin system VapC family toxin [Alkalinema pantanalense CENA528]|uniref:type II toxin-antitoxin system VapC family toxin n=1 Tax=Alkalinema pantanalense TaxID=1620705 RepID=UPI003D6ED294
MIQTFIDTGVLITAARGNDSTVQTALNILHDPDREFACSPFLQLELLPKAIYNQRQPEVDFYEAYFAIVTHWATDLDGIVATAYREVAEFGLGAMDALHIAAAVAVSADEFITNEKPGKSIHRTPSIRIISIRESD